MPWNSASRDEVRLLVREIVADDFSTPGTVPEHHDGVTLSDERLRPEHRDMQNNDTVQLVRKTQNARTHAHTSPHARESPTRACTSPMHNERPRLTPPRPARR